MVEWKDEPWLAFDVETTGLWPEAGDRIVELAMVVVQRGKLVDRRVTRINPGIPIPDVTSKIHGIYDADVVDSPTMEDIAESVCEHAAVAPLALAYNAPFDLKFMAACCPGWEEATSGLVVLDPLVLVRTDMVGRYWPGKGRHKLVAVVEKLGIRITGERAHMASWDALAAALVLWELRDHLPDDLFEADEYLAAERQRQDDNHANYRARQA